MLRSAKLRLAVLSLLLTVLPLSPAQAVAPLSGGISLSPATQELTIQPDDASKEFTLTIANHTAGVQELDLSARDFGSLNDTGGVLLQGSNDYTQKYGLASWLALSTDTVILNPGESQDVTVTVENRQDLRPGGHYGAVVATVNSLEDTSGNRVVINQQLLSLILVDKVGGEHFDLKLADVTANGNWLHLPNTVKLHFQNPGNVHVIPRGLVKLEAPGGKVLAQGIINEASAFILPQSFYDMYVPLTTQQKALPLPGTYRIVVEYRYDGLDQYARKAIVLRFIDVKMLILLVIVAAVAWRIVKRLRGSKVTSVHELEVAEEAVAEPEKAAAEPVKAETEKTTQKSAKKPAAASAKKATQKLTKKPAKSTRKKPK